MVKKEGVNMNGNEDYLVVKTVKITDDKISISRVPRENKDKIWATGVKETFAMDSDVRIIYTKNSKEIKNKALSALQRIRYFLQENPDVYDESIYKGDIDEDIYFIERMINEKWK